MLKIKLQGNKMSLIAIIDDDSDILDASSLVLTSKGYEVVTADNPDDGFKIVKEKNPDLIILDVIIMYTSVSKSIGMEFGMNEMVPVDDFVEKPIAPNVLVEKVAKLLNLAVKE